jgi:hypothetical protein
MFTVAWNPSRYDEQRLRQTQEPSGSVTVVAIAIRQIAPIGYPLVN